MPKPETLFRRNRVEPMIKSLPNCAQFSVQQKSIIGDPDKMICLKGRFIGLEIKTDIGKVSPMQLIKLQRVRKAGGVALVIRPKNFEEIKQILLAIATGAHYEQHFDDIPGII